MYIIIRTCIDIIFVTFIISRFAENLNSKHFFIINQILHYLAKNQN